MTKPRFDKHSTEFGLWLRNQLSENQTDVSQIDSSKGYNTSNIDFMWMNYHTGEYIFIEEKRYSDKFQKLGYAQEQLFRILDRNAKTDSKYKGFYLLKFSGTSPEDGHIWLERLFMEGLKRDIIEISSIQLVNFLETLSTISLEVIL